jgi:hypothetical protein
MVRKPIKKSTENRNFFHHKTRSETSMSELQTKYAPSEHEQRVLTATTVRNQPQSLPINDPMIHMDDDGGGDDEHYDGNVPTSLLLGAETCVSAAGDEQDARQLPASALAVNPPNETGDILPSSIAPSSLAGPITAEHVHVLLSTTAKLDRPTTAETIPPREDIQKELIDTTVQTSQPRIKMLPPRQPVSTATTAPSVAVAAAITSAVTRGPSSGTRKSNLPGEPEVIIEDETDLRIFEILGIDPQEFTSYLYGDDEFMFERFINTAQSMVASHQDIISYLLPDQVQISCVNWKNRQFITGTGKC